MAANTDEGALRAAFETPSPLTVGLEEELMLLDPATLDLVPRADEVLAATAGDERFTRELPAGQIEIVTTPCATVPEAIEQVVAGRRDLARSTDGLVRLGGAGVHPFAPAEGQLSRGARYAAIEAEYGPIARRQLVFALQVHVAVRGSDRALAVHNALRGHLPELAALAANGAYHGGRDSGLASVRPTISEQLPRQGVPPGLPSWAAFADALRWLDDPGQWWWELRPHPAWGTLELRVPDTQATVSGAEAVASVAHALVGRLAQRFDAGEPLGCPETWRIEENRWSACRHGVAGTMADLDTGHREPTRTRLHRLLDDLEPVAEDLGCAAGVERARGLVERNGAQRQREWGARGGARAVAEALAERFLEGVGAEARR